MPARQRQPGSARKICAVFDRIGLAEESVKTNGPYIIGNLYCEHRSIGPNRQTVKTARRDGHDIAQAGRRTRLPIVIVTPPDNFTICSQCKRVSSSRCNGDYIGRAGGHIRLASVFADAETSPNDYGFVRFERHAMAPAFISTA